MITILCFLHQSHFLLFIFLCFHVWINLLVQLHIPLKCMMGVFLITSSLLCQVIFYTEHLLTPLPGISRLDWFFKSSNFSVSLQHVILIALTFSFHICINPCKFLLPIRFILKLFISVVIKQSEPLLSIHLFAVVLVPPLLRPHLELYTLIMLIEYSLFGCMHLIFFKTLSYSVQLPSLLIELSIFLESLCLSAFCFCSFITHT